MVMIPINRQTQDDCYFAGMVWACHNRGDMPSLCAGEDAIRLGMAYYAPAGPLTLADTEPSAPKTDDPLDGIDPCRCGGSPSIEINMSTGRTVIKCLSCGRRTSQAARDDALAEWRM